MAHELEIINHKAQMAWVGDLPWHGLGVQVSDDLSPEEMMIAAGVDWRVIEKESFVEINGERIPTGMKALVRDSDNKVLTQVGMNWEPVQNEEAFEFFKEFVSSGQMKMHTAGSLKNGEIVWALAKVEDNFELFNGDRVESYLLFSNPHQYGKTIDIRFTPIRVVCNNTLTLSLKQLSKNAISMDHRKRFDPEVAKSALNIARYQMNQYKERAEYLGSKRTTRDTLEQYFGELLNNNANPATPSRNVKKAMEFINTQPGAGFAEGTWWSAFNTITYMVDHELGRTKDSRLYSSWYGSNRHLKEAALELAIDFAGVS